MEERSIAVYRGLLVEIKYRTEAIDAILGGGIPMRAKIAEELCYLQFRMICELLSVGCLIIHGNLSSAKADLMKTYKADWIVKELAKLHPKFFPIPLDRDDDKTAIPPAWIHKKSGFLTHQDLAKLWQIAGDQLHRGSAKNILAKDKPLDFQAIRTWRDKIVSLLTRHIITAPDEREICYFIMNDGKDNVYSTLFTLTDLQPSKVPA
jgi:hypothetical protein